MPTRAEQAQRTRAAVLATAAQLFASRGFDGTSLQLIADTMGVRKANVYYYFRTKEEIARALLDDRVAALDELLDLAETIPELHERRELVVGGFVREVLIAHRTIAAVEVGDPGIRRLPAVAARLNELATRTLHVLFGPEPTPDEQAAFWMLNDLSPVTRRLTHLPDDELAALLRRMCLRLLPGGQ